MQIIRPYKDDHVPSDVFYYTGYYDRQYASGNFYYSWRWPEEFICGRFHVTRHPNRVTIAEEHPETIICGGTYLDLLPRDMRRAILEPMCRRVLFDRFIRCQDYEVHTESDAPEHHRFIVATMRGRYPCSIWELIDRLASGCPGSCRCMGSHQRLIKPRGAAPRRLTRREWRECNRR